MKIGKRYPLIPYFLVVRVSAQEYGVLHPQNKLKCVQNSHYEINDSDDHKLGKNTLAVLSWSVFKGGNIGTVKVLWCARAHSQGSREGQRQEVQDGTKTEESPHRAPLQQCATRVVPVRGSLVIVFFGFATQGPCALDLGVVFKRVDGSDRIESHSRTSPAASGAQIADIVDPPGGLAPLQRTRTWRGSHL